MGSEDLFHKRRPKKSIELRRGNKKRMPLKKILIVCEGEKTEPQYFSDLISHFRLSAASVIEVTGDCGSSPKSVVEHAREKYRLEDERSAPYDHVYCVFDKDSHSCYQDAIYRLKTFKPAGVFMAINSVPCFEFWLLLHFTYSTKSFGNFKENSSGNQMLNELRKFMPDYEKRKKGVFSTLVSRLDSAITNSQRARAAAADSGTDNPTTRVDELVVILQKIREEFVIGNNTRG
jgi:hypothetical protein